MARRIEMSFKEVFGDEMGEILDDMFYGNTLDNTDMSKKLSGDMSFALVAVVAEGKKDPVHIFRALAAVALTNPYSNLHRPLWAMRRVKDASQNIEGQSIDSKLYIEMLEQIGHNCNILQTEYVVGGGGNQFAVEANKKAGKNLVQTLKMASDDFGLTGKKRKINLWDFHSWLYYVAGMCLSHHKQVADEAQNLLKKAPEMCSSHCLGEKEPIMTPAIFKHLMSKLSGEYNWVAVEALSYGIVAIRDIKGVAKRELDIWLNELPEKGESKKQSESAG